MAKLNTGTSVVDYLKSQGKDSSFGSRTNLASQYGIQGYKGTADQNISLLNYLRSQKPAAATTTPAATTTQQTQQTAPTQPTATNNNQATQLQQRLQAQAQAQAQALEQLKGQVNSQYDHQLNSQMAALNSSRERAASEINAQKSLVAPEYYMQRNQADVVNQQNAQRLREMMAANGLASSGENITATVSLGNARQTALNELNKQEQQTMNEYGRQLTDLYNPNDELAIRNDIEAQRSAALYQAGRDANSDVQYLQEQQWREHTFNNMSASEKASMEQAAKQYGEDMAWRLYEMQFQGEISKSNNQALINFYKTGKV